VIACGVLLTVLLEGSLVLRQARLAQLEWRPALLHAAVAHRSSRLERLVLLEAGLEVHPVFSGVTKSFLVARENPC